MLRRHKMMSTAFAAAVTMCVTMCGTFAVPASQATASPAWSTVVCQGTLSRPGVLAGTYLGVTVKGICIVNRGPAVVRRSIWINRGSTLIAAYGQFNSHLVVDHNIYIKTRGTLLLGCEARRFPCLDDPHRRHATLHSHSIVRGSIMADGALGVVVHDSRIGGQVSELGGGGGKNCRPQGFFAALHSPVYSTYEDSVVKGNLKVKRVRSCWFGVLRNYIAGSATISSNVMANGDAMEVVSNTVLINLVCWRDAPRVQFGDSRGKPNKVGMIALYQCGFHVLRPNPAGQHAHFDHISVPLG